MDYTNYFQIIGLIFYMNIALGFLAIVGFITSIIFLFKKKRNWETAGGSMFIFYFFTTGLARLSQFIYPY